MVAYTSASHFSWAAAAAAEAAAAAAAELEDASKPNEDDARE
jgi:hypothetical protein